MKVCGNEQIEVNQGSNPPAQLVESSSYETHVDSLAKSITRWGLLQPIGVVINKDGKPVLTYGFTRVAAMEKLKVVRCKAVCYELPEGTDAEYLDLNDDTVRAAVNDTENSIRFAPVSVAQGRTYLSMMKEKDWTTRELAAFMQLEEKKVKSIVEVLESVNEKYIKLAEHADPMSSSEADGVLTVAKLTAIVNLQKTYSLSKDQVSELCESCREEGVNTKCLRLIARGMRSGTAIRKTIDDYKHDKKNYEQMGVHFRVRCDNHKKVCKKYGRFLTSTFKNTLSAVDKIIDRLPNVDPELKETVRFFKTLICTRG